MPANLTDPPPRRRRVRSGLAVTMAAPALIHPVARWLARWDWRADLLTHFQMPALAASIVGAAALWRVGRMRRSAVAMAGLAAVQVVALLQYEGANPVPPDPTEVVRLRVLAVNLLADNTRYQDLIDLVHREQPDIVALVEYSVPWARAMTSLRTEFPYGYEVPGGTRGVALWSRYPILDHPAPELVVPLDLQYPALAATIEVAGRPLSVWVVHPPNPIGVDGRSQSIPMLEELAKAIARRPGPTIVVGDMNRTEGSPLLTDFLRATGLRDSRLGFGRQPSWPSWSPYRLPIDHAFISPEWAVVDRRLGPEIGSDHFPVVLDLAPAASASMTSATQPLPASSP